MPSSETGITLSMAMLAVFWLLDGNYKFKYQKFIKNRTAHMFLLIYFVHILWLINTSNFDYAIFDLRTKFAIIVFGFIFSTSPNLSIKEFRNILLVFVMTVFISSVLGVYFYIVGDQVDYRAYSPFISHVRFALNICMSIYILGFLIVRYDSFFQFRLKINIIVKTGFILILIWLLYFLTLMQSMTGIGIVFTVFVLLMFILFFKWKKTLKFRWVFLSLFFLIPIIIVLNIFRSYDHYTTKPKINFENLEKFTKNSNPYIHDTTYHNLENGKWTGLYLCEKELREEWNKVSDQNYDSKDKNGFLVSSKIIRYLTSKDLRKDKEGLNKLKASDIENIENGIANAEFIGNFGIKSRIHNLFFEIYMFEKNSDIKGSSLIQRLELLKNAINIIYKYPVLGVGTGDVGDEVANELKVRNSELQNSGMRTHNQYITFIVSFGIIGFLLVMLSFFYPFFIGIKINDTLIIVFYIIFLISNIAEDTLESLHGAAFYSFFGALLLFLKPDLIFDTKNEI